MRVHSKKSLLAAALSLAFSAASLGDEQGENPSFSRSVVTGSIEMLSGKGGNIGVLKGEDGLLLIDDDYADMTPALETALQELGGVESVIYLINTHWHGDHTGGNELLGSHALIVAHDNVRKRLTTEQEVKLFNMKTQPYPEKALPEITYSQVITLHFGGEEVEIVHYPSGHTDGDSVVFFKNSNVVHMGDHFFNGIFPFVDVDNGGNVENMANNVKAILAQIDGDTKVIPGHGALGDKKDLQAFYDMLVGTTAEVKAMMAEGLDLAAIQERGLSEQWQPWTKGFLSTEVWIGIIHASLSRQK
ncbi:MAG: MBL fold metallo-hydrolase [Porticoccaceae bacterium]|nr:MBL fold metallo-hydrolase [Porticoccaceae bacterium]